MADQHPDQKKSNPDQKQKKLGENKPKLQVESLEPRILMSATWVDVDHDGHDELVGTPGHDTLVGTPDADEIYGMDGNDHLVGNLGDDVMHGGAGDDVFDLNASGDGDFLTIDGGADHDIIDLSDHDSSSVVFGEHSLHVQSGPGESFDVEYSNVEQIQLSDGTATVASDGTVTSDDFEINVQPHAVDDHTIDDVAQDVSLSVDIGEPVEVHHESADDSPYEALPTNIIDTPTQEFNNANSDIYGSSGDNEISIHGNLNSNVYLSGGDDVVDVDGNIGARGNVYARSGDNTVRVDGDVDGRLFFEGGNDQVEIGGSLNNQLYAGSGNDQVHVGGDVDNTVYLQDGNDVLDVDGDAHAKIYAHGGDDVVHVDGSTSQRVYLDSGNDELDIGHDAHDKIYAGSGDDTIHIGGDADNRVYLESGHDNLEIGGTAGNEIYAGDGNDHIVIGGDTTNRVYLESGDDFLHVEGQVGDQIYAGSGTDSIELGHYTLADYNNNVDSIRDHLIEFENIKFSDGEVIGDASAFTDHVDIDHDGGSTTYEYSVDINASLNDTDGSEVLSQVKIDHLPDGVTLKLGDTLLTAETDGSYLVDVTSGHATTLTLVSDTHIEPNDFHFTTEVTATELSNGDTATTVVTGEGAVIGTHEAESTISTHEDNPLVLSVDDLLANDSDAGGDALSIVSVQDATHGSVELNSDGTVTFTPDADYNGAASFTYTVSDGHGGSDTATVSIDVEAVEDAPIVDAGADQTVNEGDLVTLSADASDPDGQAVSYEWVQTSGPEVTLSDAHSANPTFTAPEGLSDSDITFELHVSDGTHTTVDTMTVTVNADNDAPTDIALSNLTVTENASDGAVVAHVSVTDPESADTFTYALTDDADGRFEIDPHTGVIRVKDGDLLNHESASSHDITVSVTDSGGNVLAETFTINVNDVNESIDGGGLDISEHLTTDSLETFSYGFENAPVGSNPRILDFGNGVTAVVSSTGAKENAILEGSDGHGAVVGEGGKFWKLRGGETTLTFSEPISELSLMYSDYDGWNDITFTAGGQSISLSKISSNVSETLTFTATDGQPITELTIVWTRGSSDGLGIDGLTITPAEPVEIPVLPDSAEAGTVVGNVQPTDPDAGETYTYDLISDADGRFEIDDNGTITVADGAEFDHDAEDSYTLTVEIEDSAGHTQALDFTVDIAGNALPTIDAGDDFTVEEGDLVTLDASASDLDGDALTVEWVQTSGPSVTLDDSSALHPTFTAPEGVSNTDITFELHVSDGVDTSTDSVTVTVNADNDAPNADAGDDITVEEVSTIQLQGSATDQDSSDLTYEWVQTSGPTVQISDATAANPHIRIPDVSADTDVTFELHVSDGNTESVDTVTVSIEAVDHMADGSLDLDANDGEWIDIDVAGGLNTSDLSAGGEVIIRGVPDGAQLNVGVNRGYGVWVVSAEEVDDVQLLVPEGAQDFELTMEHNLIANGTFSITGGSDSAAGWSGTNIVTQHELWTGDRSLYDMLPTFSAASVTQASDVSSDVSPTVNDAVEATTDGVATSDGVNNVDTVEHTNNGVGNGNTPNENASGFWKNLDRWLSDLENLNRGKGNQLDALAGQTANNPLADFFAEHDGWSYDAFVASMADNDYYGPEELLGIQATGLSQDVTAEAGQAYTVSFQLMANPDMDDVEVSFGGEVVGTISASDFHDGAVWQTFEFTVRGDGTAQTLSIESVDSNGDGELTAMHINSIEMVATDEAARSVITVDVTDDDPLPPPPPEFENPPVDVPEPVVEHEGDPGVDVVVNETPAPVTINTPEEVTPVEAPQAMTPTAHEHEHDSTVKLSSSDSDSLWNGDEELAVLDPSQSMEMDTDVELPHMDHDADMADQAERALSEIRLPDDYEDMNFDDVFHVISEGTVSVRTPSVAIASVSTSHASDLDRGMEHLDSSIPESHDTSGGEAEMLQASTADQTTEHDDVDLHATQDNTFVANAQEHTGGLFAALWGMLRSRASEQTAQKQDVSDKAQRDDESNKGRK